MNRKRLGWIAAILLTLLLVGCGSDADSTETSSTNEGKTVEGSQNQESRLQDEVTVGTIRIGDSDEKMLSELGIPISSAKLSDYSEEFTNGDDRTMYGYQEGTLYTVEGVVYQIDLSKQNAETKSGLAKWDDRAKALALYSKYEKAVANLHQLQILEDGYFFIVEFEGGDASEFSLIDAKYRIKPKLDAFGEAEKYRGTALHVNGFGSCGDLNVFRYVKELIDPSTGLWDGNEGSCYPHNKEQNESNPGTYDSAEQEDTAERSDGSQPTDSATEASLIDGFKGKWCDSDQMLCFEVAINDNETGGSLDYYQEQEPYEEKFRIPYMDEYEMVIELEAGASQVRLSLSDDKQSMAYESDFNTATMIRQD
ncbi:hypothetical protein [Cohnella cholangitidis]|uniref:Uncharacterized protein n=1 Tax=Cohnella cholangitidis TaxID=2598458 RepID=A0A7G5C4Y2_9BACL|nr:hypothetical protein [Cohnella cholangitidis]QMV44266.1 hypothetical protein FPL14_26185 [Cohnella cholangitidis]